MCCVTVKISCYINSYRYHLFYFIESFAKNLLSLFFLKSGDKERSLKGQCHEIFELIFFSLIELIWAPDKQA